jgi:hypothetical protein
VPSTTLREIPPEEQAQRRAVLRRTRSGDLLAFHRLLVGAVGRNPTEMAAFLCCARSRVYRLVRAYRTGSLGSRVDQAGATLQRGAVDSLHALAHARSGHHTHKSPTGLRLGPPPVALGDPRRHAPSHTRHRGRGGHQTALAP